MKTHAEKALRAIEILESIKAKLDLLYIKHQEEQDARNFYKKAA